MRALLAQLRVELLLVARRGENLLVTLVVPLVLLVFFGAVMPVPMVAADTGPVEFLVPGILALAVMSTSLVSLGIATAFERSYGVLKRLLGSPLPRRSLLLAKSLSVLVVEALQVALVLLVAHLALGWNSAGSIPLALLALLIGSFAFAGIGLLLAGTLRAEATLAAANGLYLFFLLVGGFIFPVELLPQPLSGLARVLPAAALADATRSALVGPAAEALLPMAILCAWAVLGAAAAARTFRPE